jgi:allantoin racemase
MRLWYQSLTRPDAWPAYNAALRRLLDQAADPGTTIDVHGIEQRGGIGDQYRYLEFIETIEVLENVRRAEREGYDAVLLGNIADPGLQQARELAGIPVLGLCETVVHLSCMMGARFGIVASNDKHRVKVEENITAYGLRSRLVASGRMRVERLVDLDLGFREPAARDDLLSRFTAAAEEVSAAGAEVVIPAVGVVMTLVAEAGITRLPGGALVPNGVAALVKAGEMAVKLRALQGGNFTSRRLAYARPPQAQMAELTKAYGGIYASGQEE